jgi:hypothetical protein
MNKFTYLKKEGSELWMYSNEKEMPKHEEYTSTLNWELNMKDWLSTCQRVQVYPSEVEKVRSLAYIQERDRQKRLTLFDDEFVMLLETGILIPSGALRVEKGCVCNSDQKASCLGGWDCKATDFAFLNEETKHAEEKKYSLADLRDAFDFGLHTLSVYRSKKLEREHKIFEQFLITRREK